MAHRTQEDGQRLCAETPPFYIRVWSIREVAVVCSRSQSSHSEGQLYWEAAPECGKEEVLVFRDNSFSSSHVRVGCQTQKRCDYEDQAPLSPGKYERLEVDVATIILTRGDIPKGTPWNVYRWDAWCLPQDVQVGQGWQGIRAPGAIFKFGKDHRGSTRLTAQFFLLFIYLRFPMRPSSKKGSNWPWPCWDGHT